MISLVAFYQPCIIKGGKSPSGAWKPVIHSSVWASKPFESKGPLFTGHPRRNYVLLLPWKGILKPELPHWRWCWALKHGGPPWWWWPTMMMVVLKTTDDHQAMASKHSEPLPRTLPCRTPALSTLAVRLYSSFDHCLPWGAGQVTSPLGREGYVIRLPQWGRNGKTVARPKKPMESTLQDKEPEDTGAQRPSISSWFGWKSHGCSQWRGEGSSTALESDKLWGFGYSM